MIRRQWSLSRVKAQPEKESRGGAGRWAARRLVLSCPSKKVPWVAPYCPMLECGSFSSSHSLHRDKATACSVCVSGDSWEQMVPCSDMDHGRPVSTAGPLQPFLRWPSFGPRSPAEAALGVSGTPERQAQKRGIFSWTESGRPSQGNWWILQ